MSLFEKLDNKTNEQNNVSRTERMRHSRSYQAFFEGYSEKYVTDDFGKKKIVRTYVGHYYRQDVSSKTRILLKIIYLVIALGGLSTYILGAIKQENKWYISLPVAVAIPFIFLLLVALYNYISAPKDMKIYQYRKAVVGLKRNAGISAGILALCIIGNIVCCIEKSFVEFNAYSLIFFTVSFMCWLAILCIEIRIQYQWISNEVEDEEGFELGC